MNTDRDIAALAALLEAAQRVVFFTGAGISTESGIPDFRSPGGIWTKQRPIDFDEFMSSEAARLEAWRRKFESHNVLRDARPNRGHRAVAALLRSGKARSVITQNIDGLHQASGVPDELVIELHGNSTYARCLECGERHEIAPLEEAFRREEKAPRCEECGGVVKTATISFGQAMPSVAMQRAGEETLAADLFVVLGSSLVVYPAAGFPSLASENGARLVIVNREPTGLDHTADLVINRSIGETLGAATGTD